MLSSFSNSSATPRRLEAVFLRCAQAAEKKGLRLRGGRRNQDRTHSPVSSHLSLRDAVDQSQALTVPLSAKVRLQKTSFIVPVVYLESVCKTWVVQMPCRVLHNLSLPCLLSSNAGVAPHRIFRNFASRAFTCKVTWERRGVSCKFPAAAVPSVLWIFVEAVISRSSGTLKEISATCLLRFRDPHKGSSLQLFCVRSLGRTVHPRRSSRMLLTRSVAARDNAVKVLASRRRGGAGFRPWIVRLQPHDIL